MKSYQQGSAVKGLALILVLPIGIIAHFIVFPLAAWNHDLVLLVVAAVAPAAYIQILKASGAFVVKTKAVNMAERIKGHMFVVLLGILLWNHLWLLIIPLVIAFMVLNKITKKK